MRLSRHHAWGAAVILDGGGTRMKNHKPYLHFHKIWLAVGWAGIIGVIYLSLMPEPPSFDAGLWSDKIGHSLAYTLLMLWFAQLYRDRSKEMSSRTWLGGD